VPKFLLVASNQTACKVGKADFNQVCTKVPILPEAPQMPVSISARAIYKLSLTMPGRSPCIPMCHI